MPALSSRAVASFERSLSSGRVFARVEFVKKDIDSFVEDLQYAALPGTIESAAKIREAGSKVLAFLKSNYPKESSATAASRDIDGKDPSGIVDGWRVKFYSAGFLRSGTASLLGFYIDHRNSASARVRMIIASLESGSRRYTIRAKRPRKMLRFWAGGMSEDSDVAFAREVVIPARRGFGFLKKTEDFASSLEVAHGSMLENEIAAVIEKGKRFRTAPLSQSAVESEGISARVAEAASTIGARNISGLLSSQRSPLGKVMTLKKRLASRRFSSSFR
jgi:hypothetical protein